LGSFVVSTTEKKGDLRRKNWLTFHEENLDRGGYQRQKTSLRIGGKGVTEREYTPTRLLKLKKVIQEKKYQPASKPRSKREREHVESAFNGLSGFAQKRTFNTTESGSA